MLGAANRVLYGAPGGAPTSPIAGVNTSPSTSKSTSPSASTPKTKGTKQNTQSDDVINRKLDAILEKLTKLDALEEKFVKMEGNVKKIDDRVSEMERRSSEFEKAMIFISKSVDDLNKRVDDIGNAHTDSGDAGQMQSDLHKLMDENKQMRDTITDLKCRSMKNNLIFTGLGGEHPDENTEEKLRDFIYHELRIHFHIPFGNVHRFGRSAGGRPRPIVARFLYHRDLLDVKNSASRLKGTQYGN